MNPGTIVLRLRHLAEYLLVRVFISLIQAVSIETCQRLTRGLAWLCADVIRIRQRLVDDNLQIAFPESSPEWRRRTTRKMWEHLLLMVCEIAHAPRKIHETNWRKFVAVHRKRELMLGFLSRRPKLVVTAHFGNFEIGGYIAGFWGFQTYTVARTLDNPYLDRLVNRFRESMGQIILPTQQSAGQADALLSGGGTLVLVGDQHASAKGVWVEFMGRPASCHKALALFSLLNESPMMVTYVRRLGRPMYFEVGLSDVFDPAAPGNEDLRDVSELTQWYNDAMEVEIRRTPHQYWWLHHRWRDAPPERRKRRRKKKLAALAQPDEQRPAA
jgi:KDO2-lipid IV(A) lauroyltransferase